MSIQRAPSRRINELRDDLDPLLAPDSRGAMFAVMDASVAPDIVTVLRDGGYEWASLYSGRDGDRLADVAPYLVGLSSGTPFSGWIAERWADHVGILIRSRSPFDSVRRALREWVVVEVENQVGRYLFRFYDPRVLRALMDDPGAGSAPKLFESVSNWYAPTPDGRGVLSFSYDGREITGRELKAKHRSSNGTDMT